MKQKRFLILVLVLALVGAAAISVFAAEPGSSEDPVVTQSYVDAQIAAALGEGGAVFTAINVPAGSSLIGAGGTELVLRSGQATAIDNGADGVSDLTGARDLKGGDTVEANHLLLVPRDDGRGIRAVTEIWVMVKGGYTIQ
ncbi:MAG: hypothetical protein Q4C22_00360 [Bacillota bacterium]|nr:hypothetical protein [Bacillota bacterium]